jgi:hypothetical protein
VREGRKGGSGPVRASWAAWKLGLAGKRSGGGPAGKEKRGKEKWAGEEFWAALGWNERKGGRGIGEEFFPNLFKSFKFKIFSKFKHFKPIQIIKTN